MAAIALGSVAAGIAEASVLSLVAYIAATMSSGSGGELAIGPIDINAPMSLLLIVAGILAIIRLVLQILVVRLPARLSGRVQTQLRAELFDAFLAASWDEKAKEKEGHLQELMGGQTEHAGGGVIYLAQAFSALLMFLTLAVSAFVLSVGVAAAVIATTVALLAGLRPLSRRVRDRSKSTSSASVSQASAIAESVRMAEELHVFGAAEVERSRIRTLVESLQEHFVRTRTLSATIPVLYESAMVFLLVGGLALLYGIGTTRLAALGAVVLLLVRAASYGQRLQTAYQGLGEAIPYLDGLRTAIERFRGRPAHPGNRPIESIRTIGFESVSFSYKAGAPVLRDISFSIKPGEAVGVVGPTGAGKSTLLQLLLRLRDPSTGVYRVNKFPARDILNEAWHRKVAYLPQEPHLLNGTIAENIRFHRAYVDDESIERAARMAHIHEEILSWTEGYETIVGQRADAVSGGQRQRLCLARALAGSPEFLILDEPTSSLDLHSEKLIQESLEGLVGNVILFVVAHRVTTLNLCSRVMVIRDGYLEAFGPADLLYESNDFYRHSVDLAAAGRPVYPAPHPRVRAR